MHSGSILLIWLAGVTLVQLLSPVTLTLALGGALLFALALAPQRMRRLVRRIRLFLLVIGVLFAWFTPGEALIPAWPSLSPSKEGVEMAYLHGARLLVVVCAVALLLERLPADRLVSGLYALCRPFARAGLSAERLALRLMLVFRYVEGGGGRGWKDWLGEQGEGDEAPVLLQRERLGWLEAVMLGGLVVVWAGWLLW
ncbi:hypothetical protein GPA19_04835 [Azoarcus indigens]|uniref:Cobalt transport protein n=1 Tax=Azoarcus indigens TaxID=29545 RepID=A0A4R6DY02_9RHOO|nr:CbiQ family ECF transporter T component [Azoarcus indigens]NMG64271.1 hypothetical protein [Azoarcus indigens]TDN49278.1 cobalt transport protein [Azoarcus indigens]